ncbi:hypothetical protein LMH73_014450 [Vibrio splendidus]|nr:hypothetical protein [Vibrio splendidus]MCC4882505.1 hypothetical protein [Vibrio splendidus]
MSSILVNQISAKLNFLESTLNALYDKPDFSNKSIQIFKELNSYLKKAAEQESGSDYKQSHHDKLNLLFNRQGNFITGVDNDAINLIHHFLSSSTGVIEVILRHDIETNQSVPLASRVMLMSKIMQTVNGCLEYVEVECECHSKPYRNYIGKDCRSEMSPDELYQYLISHAVHSPNDRNIISTAALIRYIEKGVWHDAETALEVIQRLHSCTQVFSGDESLDKAINLIIGECMIGIPK